MITQWEMYWLTRCDSLNAFVFGIGLTIAIIGGILLIAYLTIKACTAGSPSESDKAANAMAGRVYKPMYWTLGAGMLLLMFSVFIPTTKEYAAIKVVPALANDTLKEDLGEIYTLAKEWAKDELKELSAEVKKPEE